MKEGVVIPVSDDISDEEMKSINKFTKRELKKTKSTIFAKLFIY